MAWWTTHPRWTGGPSFFHSRAGARWIAAALATVVFLGYVVWLHGDSTQSPASSFAQNFFPIGDKPTVVNGAPLLHLPAWIDTPSAFEFDAAGDVATAELNRPLALHSRVAPAVQAFLARPVLSHVQAITLNEARCPRTQLDEQVNKDQLRGEHDHWISLTAENVTSMRWAAVEFLERREDEEGEGALLGPGFGPEGQAVEKGSRGVVIAAGNKRTVERAELCIKELQRLGWKGGVEVWHFEAELQGEKERGALEALGVGIHMVSAAVALGDGTEGSNICVQVSTKKAPGQWKNFELKAEAILRSSFDEVLFLDSDNFPLSDISALFDAPLFTDPSGGRAVFWPDLNRDHPDNAIHRVLGIPCHSAWQLDSGQVLIAKSGNDGLNLAALYMASHMQTEGGYWFSGGDKDTL